MAQNKYQRICVPPMEEEENSENLVPKRRTRHYKHLGFIIVFLFTAIIATLVWIYGDCYIFANLKSEVKTNSSSNQPPSECETGNTSKGLLLMIVSVSAGVWTLARITYMMVLFCEELHHRKQCHKGSFIKTFTFVFYSPGEKMLCGAAAVLLVTVFMSLYMFKCYHVPCCDFVVLPIIICYLLFFSTFNYQEPTGIEKALLNAETTSAKIGGGLSHWFYFGYLKLILCPNDEKPSIKQRIAEYKAKQQLDDKIPFPDKLFILFPTSCFTYRLLTDLDSSRIEQRQKLGELVIERAGITERTFNNSVYRIIETMPQEKQIGVTDNNIGTDREYLAVVEYATPLDTLYNLSKRGTSEIHLSSEQRREEVFRFYRELRTLLEDDPACSDTFVLVLYDDESVLDKKSCMLNALIKKIKENLPAN